MCASPAANNRPIARTFARLKQAGKLAFIPFITAGDPDLNETLQAARLLVASGADLLEIGFPYSDPIADGPVIQASYTRALNAKVKLAGVFEMIGTLSKETTIPLLAMVSYSIVFRAGPESFLRQAAAAGMAGLIVPDLPGDEAAEFSRLLQSAGLDLITLVAPTTPRPRMQKIVANASGFIYCIAVTGITGVRTAEAPSHEALDRGLKELRTMTQLPLCVGFGISRPEHVTRLHGLADGAIVGSAIVRLLEGWADSDHPRQQMQSLAASLATAAHTP